MDEGLGQYRAERAGCEVRPDPRRQHHPRARQRARLAEQVEGEQPAVRVRGALDEEPALDERSAQRRQRPRHRGLVVLAQDIERADHTDALSARQRQIEAAVAEGKTRLGVRLSLRHPRGIDFNAQHLQPRIQPPQSVKRLLRGHGIGAIAQIHVEAGQVADEGGERHRQEGVRLPQAIGGGLPARGLTERLSHRARS
jgi:hypothetical protein